jgi:hypothetical protein
MAFQRANEIGRASNLAQLHIDPQGQALAANHAPVPHPSRYEKNQWYPFWMHDPIPFKCTLKSTCCQGGLLPRAGAGAGGFEEV